MADLSELDLLSKKKLPAPAKGKEKSKEKAVAKTVSKVRLPGRGPEKTSPTGLWAEPPQAAPAEPSRLNDQPMDFEITAEQQEIRDRLTAINPGAMDAHNNIISVDDQENNEEDADRARERRHFDQAIRTASRISDDQNRRLDGIPRRQADGQANPKQPKTTEEVHLTEVTEEEILHAVVESRLSSEEKKAFTEAKRKALTPWSENDAWRAVRRDKCPKGTIVPMRFLLRYKEDKPHARVILQGFKHKDVLESKLDTESPTISRLGKYLMVLMACCMKWRIGTMDVKSAFLQSDYIHQEVEIYGEPSADMRRLLAEMVGLKEHEVMQMTKPAFGDVRAPRQWNETADAALTSEVGLLKHELDGCIYISVRLATAEDHKFKVFEMDGYDYVVDGLFGLHVDDIMACGEWVTRDEDAKAPEGDKPCCFAERLHVLLHRFKFGSIEYHDQQTFCGTQMTQAMDGSSVSFNLEKYIHQMKPLTIEKSRKQQPNERVTPREQSQLLGLLGALAWPSFQTQPHLAASVSLAQSASASANISDLLEVNKTLRFAKETANTHLVIRSHGSLHKIRFGMYCDATWATRPDGSSQGGWLIFVANTDEINNGKPFPLTVIDWASKRLTRVCRSSLAAEAQTLAMAVDSLEWLKCLFALMIWPNQRPDNEDIMKWLGESPCITDARALYDASVSKAPGMKLAEKRAAIEIKMSCERMAALAGMLRWCNSHQQLADGMTKTSARLKLAVELKRRMHSLLYDPQGVASKKVKKEEKQEEQDMLDRAAKEFEYQKKIQDGIYTVKDMDEAQLNLGKVASREAWTPVLPRPPHRRLA